MPHFARVDGCVDAVLPVRGSRSSAGYDVYAYEHVEIKSGCDQIVRTGICVRDMSPLDCIQVWARSGLSCKYMVETGAGLIDSDYTGEIKVHLYNYGSSTFVAQKGDRIAQLVCVRLGAPFENVEGLRDDQERGTQGFGSSG